MLKLTAPNYWRQNLTCTGRDRKPTTAPINFNIRHIPSTVRKVHTWDEKENSFGLIFRLKKVERD